MDINGLTMPTLMPMCAYMFIGGSPNSVGGGIRTTTFALNMLFLYYYAKGVTSFLSIIGSGRKEAKFHYPEERVMTG